MKGIILSEFIEFLESSVGAESAQLIIENSGIASDGAYCRVGHYDYQELIQLLTQAVKETNRDTEDLLASFADHLFGVFKRDYDVFFHGVSSAAEMLAQIDNHIHVEVKKLYPDAELPKFEYVAEGQKITMNYKSPRPLAAVADALLNACIKHFGGGETVVHGEISDDQREAKFIIQLS